VRIWTPLTDMSLRVDLATGESLPLDVLSSGTREAVFLSLRLALVADFSRRGIVLPLILDDVLVNFDRLRARNAAHVLLDFADRGHQVLMFTCHEHIVELFTGAQVEIRYLSDFVPSQRVAVATPLPPPIVEIRAPQPDKHQELPEEPEEVEATAESVAVLDEDYGLAEPVDEYAEEDYELGDAVHVLQPSPLEFFLEPAEQREDVAAAVAEYGDQDDEELVEVEEESKQEAVGEGQPVRRHRMQQRFTWESPERWWDADRNDEAA
jgi:hypothetical protein